MLMFNVIKHGLQKSRGLNAYLIDLIHGKNNHLVNFIKRGLQKPRGLNAYLVDLIQGKILQTSRFVYERANESVARAARYHSQVGTPALKYQSFEHVQYGRKIL